MAPMLDSVGTHGADAAGLGLIVRLSDVRRLGAWQRVGARSASGGGGIARRAAMRAALAQAAARAFTVRHPVVSAASDAAPVDVVPPSAICARHLRSSLRSIDPAQARLLCAVAA